MGSAVGVSKKRQNVPTGTSGESPAPGSIQSKSLTFPPGPGSASPRAAPTPLASASDTSSSIAATAITYAPSPVSSREPAGTKLSICIEEKVSIPNRIVSVLVRVDVDEGTYRTPSDICCVIDISGSMGLEAKIQGESGGTESQGLTLLDVAKHGVRTIAHALGNEDRLSIVAFNHGARRVLDLTVMDEKGHAIADEKITSLTPGGGTDIWKGIYDGLESLREGAGNGRFAHLMVLTDGETNNRESVLPGICDYRAVHEGLPGTICTFGFGYNLDSQLLTAIALAGDGSYSFIPDAGFVGTAFVNTLSNLLTTTAKDVRLSLDAEDNEIDKVIGHEFSKDSQGMVSVNLGLLQYGQSKDIVLRVSIKTDSEDFLAASLSYKVIDGQQKDIRATAATLAAGAEVVEPELWRSRYVDVVHEALKACATQTTSEASRQAAAVALQSLSDEIKKSRTSGCANVPKLLEDIDGQSAEAFSKMDYLTKWGRHYMPSIMFAHKLQQCNNFKDPGVQLYGGKLFREVQEQADDIFNSLPPPQPSVLQSSQAQRSQTVPAAPVNMAAYNNRFAS